MALLIERNLHHSSTEDIGLTPRRDIFEDVDWEFLKIREKLGIGPKNVRGQFIFLTTIDSPVTK